MTAAIVLAVLCVLVLLANLRWQFDVNTPRHYTQRLTNKASYPKAYVHGITAFAIALAALVLGAYPLWVLAILGIAIVLWEFTQRGTVDGWDILAGYVGLLDALLVVWIARALA